MIVGVLLAAGGARRFGSQKLVATLGGLPIVRHSANVLAAVTDALVVVVGHEALAVREALDGLPATFASNDDWRRGLSALLRCGIESVPDEALAAIVALGDQPGVDVDIYRRVIDVWRTTGTAIVAARYRGTRGHPVLFDRSMFAELLATTGDSGAKGVIDRDAERVAYVDVDRAMPRDVDSPADLAALDAHSPSGSHGGIVEPHNSTDTGDE